MNAFHKRLVSRWAWLLAAGILAVLLPGGCASTGKALPAAPSPGALVPASGARTIKFSGYTWTIKSSTEQPVDPGPNYYSDDPADVFVDPNGSLHMRIVKRDGKWYSTEVIGNLPLDYGSYTWATTTPLYALDRNAVLGLFTWDDLAKDFHHREIDIEIARWNETAGPNIQYVVQPYDTPGNRVQFNLPLTHSSIFRFDWTPTQVQFDSWEDKLHVPWTFTRPADIPPAGTGNPHINLWLFHGTPPQDGRDIEVVIEAFHFQHANRQYIPTQKRTP